MIPAIFHPYILTKAKDFLSFLFSWEVLFLFLHEMTLTIGETSQFKMNLKGTNAPIKLVLRCWLIYPMKNVLYYIKKCGKLKFNVLDVSDSGAVETCCDASQVLSLSNSLNLMKMLLARCPACMRNIRIPFCYMTCSPMHTSFVTPVQYAPANFPDKLG